MLEAKDMDDKQQQPAPPVSPEPTQEPEEVEPASSRIQIDDEGGDSPCWAHMLDEDGRLD
jgi:hypothetical protein